MVGFGQPEFKLGKFWIRRFFIVRAIRTRLGLKMIELMAETLDETRNVRCDLGSGENRITPVRVNRSVFLVSAPGPVRWILATKSSTSPALTWEDCV